MRRLRRCDGSSPGRWTRRKMNLTNRPPPSPRQMLNHITRWTVLRGIGNSSVTKLTIIIPLVGYLIIFNEHALQYLELSHRLFGTHETSLVSAEASARVSPRLLSVYFGLCLVAAASTIFSIFCPREIKRHSGAAEYTGGDGKNLSISQLSEIAATLDKDNPRFAAFIEFSETLERDKDSYSVSQHRQQREDLEVEGLRLWFEKLDEIFPSARLATAVLFGIGLVVLTIPSLDVFIRVSLLLMKSLFNLTS